MAASKEMIRPVILSSPFRTAVGFLILSATAGPATNDPANALRYYNLVIAENRSDFLVRAATRAAELETKQKNYPRAVRNYGIILNKAGDKAERAGFPLVEAEFVPVDHPALARRGQLHPRALDPARDRE